MAYSSSGASQMRYVVLLCLLLISKFTGVASKQMADNVPQIKYDIFVSFRGEDIRHGFLGYLTEAFHKKQIHAFLDHKLEKGYEIWSSLVGAIKGSLISLTIFSGNYASSRWCLEELVKILECREKYGQTVIPVFYNVYPTTVRHQKESYQEAFVEHEKKYNLITVQTWRDALKKAADLSGITSFNYKSEVELLGEIINIVNLVLMRSSKHPLNIKGLIGIDKPIQYLEWLLHQESKNVRVIGIWGMGGIGKTTIAKAIFNKLYAQYDVYYFLANVKEESRRHGTDSLKENLFSTLLGEKVGMHVTNGLSNYIKRRIGRMKVLIVLDDVYNSDILEKLFENHDWFGSGSRILITTRDKQVLIANKVDDIYQVGALNPNEALELFNLYAFNQNHFDMEYYELSKRVVNYANGIPLVLKVLGNLLCGKDKEVWESQLDKLKKMPNPDVYDVMRLSYDDLDHKEQKIFLDLACFFIGENVDNIKILLKDNEEDNSVAVGLERLKDKALITISIYNYVYMHDILQEMAWEIVRLESIEDLGSRSRLRDPNDIYRVLQNDKGTKAIRSIWADLSLSQKLKLSPHIFTKMSGLQFLHFSTPHFDPLPHGLQSFPAELRYLAWNHYPLKSLPKTFSAENLVILDLSDSKVERLWDGVQNLENLKQVRVSGSINLKKLPDLSKATNLEVLDISFCPKLTNVDPSILSLSKLKELDLSECSLRKLTSENPSLSRLELRSCTKVRKLSVTSGVNELPSSFGRQCKLKILSLRGTGIKSLPSCFKNLTRLLGLEVADSKELHTITELPPSLKYLDATNSTSLKTVLFPSIAEQFKENRKHVLFWNCLKLDEHSLNDISLNARINVMKYAYQHLSTSDENYDDYNLKYLFYQANYVYPGNRVPEWLEYKTTKDYMIIDLSSTPHSSLLGFIFCFVVSYTESERANSDKFKFHITISGNDEDESKKDSIDIYTFSNSQLLSDHVCVVYDQRCSSYLNSRAKNRTRFKIKVNAMAEAAVHQWGLGLKGFGVSTINTSGYHHFIEHINTTTDHSFIQQTNTSADHSSFHQMEVSDLMYFIPILSTILCISLWCFICRHGFRRLLIKQNHGSICSIYIKRRQNSVHFE